MNEEMSELSFEAALARLEEITTQIQKSLELFKEGDKLAKKASALLENAKLSLEEYQKGEQ